MRLLPRHSDIWARQMEAITRNVWICETEQRVCSRSEILLDAVTR